MYHWIVNMRLQAILECFVDDVIRSQNKSKLWTTIALSKFELEKRSTAQNVANWTGYQKFKFQFHIQISKFWQVRNLRLPFHFCFVFHWSLFLRVQLKLIRYWFRWRLGADKATSHYLNQRCLIYSETTLNIYSSLRFTDAYMRH